MLKKQKLSFFVLMAIYLTSCATFQKPVTPDEIRAKLDCLEYKEGISWKNTAEKFGKPDFVPLPEPGTDLSKYVRGYKDKVIIFHVERQEFKEDGKTRFHEVITRIEVCKEK